MSFLDKVFEFLKSKIEKPRRKKGGASSRSKKDIEKRLTDYLNNGKRRGRFSKENFSSSSSSKKRVRSKSSEHEEYRPRVERRPLKQDEPWGLEKASASGKEKDRGTKQGSKRVYKSSKPSDAKLGNVGEKKDFVQRFGDLSISKELLEALSENNFYEPTEVQKSSIPVVLSGSNLLCVSQTGSGKTLAFVLPILDLLLQKKIGQSLIVCPTREIAFQISGVIEPFKKAVPFSSALLIGGEDYQTQKEHLRAYPEIIVATPGRLVDMMNQGLVWLEYTEAVVLDEADRMMDMGFEKELNQIMEELKNRRQVLLFTATLMDSVKKIIKKYVKQYEEVIIGHTTSASENVEHSLIKVKSLKEKDVLLEDILKRTKGKVIVFFNKIEDVKKKYSFFEKKGIKNIVSLHSGKTQEERKEVIERFSRGNKRIIFATDIISRGLDVPNVELVVNYDLPMQPEEYIHRIGRTGRAGLQGEAKSFCLAKDAKHLEGIERILGKAIPVEGANKKIKEINQSGE